MVRRIVARNPGMMTGPGTNTYLVGIDEIVVVDPGPADDAHLDAIAGCGGDRIRWIVVTHTHPDHSPGVAGLVERTGAEVLAFDARDDLEVDRTLARRRHDRGDRVPPRRAPHARPRVEPPLLLAARGAPAVLGRPHHAGLDGRHQPTRRRHGGVPQVARAAPHAQATPPRDRARATGTSSRTRTARSTSTSRTAVSASSRCSRHSRQPARRRRPSSSSASTSTRRRAEARGGLLGLGAPAQARRRGRGQRRRRHRRDVEARLTQAEQRNATASRRTRTCAWAIRRAPAHGRRGRRSAASAPRGS